MGRAFAKCCENYLLVSNNFSLLPLSFSLMVKRLPVLEIYYLSILINRNYFKVHYCLVKGGYE